MKILHVGKFYSPIEGGIESINRFVVDSLKKHQQRVLSFNNRNISTEEDVDGIPVVRAASQGIYARQPVSYRYFRELKRNIKLFDPDVVHFHYPNPLGALFINILIGKKRKLIVHWHSDIIAQKYIHHFIAPLEHKLLKKADIILATSPIYRDCSEPLNRYKEKVTVIPCSIDEERLKLRQGDHQRIESLKNKYSNKPIILFIGRHVEYKGLRYLLEAEQHIKTDCVILIGGQGPLTEELKQKFTSKRILWLGRLEDDDLRIYYNAATIFTFPSITKNEAFGVVLAEAMYCRTPTVTFTIRGSGVNWVSPNGLSGIEVADRNAVAYAAAIDMLLTDKELSTKLGLNAKERVEKMFTKDIVSGQYKKLYDNIELK